MRHFAALLLIGCSSAETHAPVLADLPDASDAHVSDGAAQVASGGAKQVAASGGAVGSGGATGTGGRGSGGRMGTGGAVAVAYDAGEADAGADSGPACVAACRVSEARLMGADGGHSGDTFVVQLLPGQHAMAAEMREMWACATAWSGDSCVFRNYSGTLAAQVSSDGTELTFRLDQSWRFIQSVTFRVLTDCGPVILSLKRTQFPSRQVCNENPNGPTCSSLAECGYVPGDVSPTHSCRQLLLSEAIDGPFQDQSCL